MRATRVKKNEYIDQNHGNSDDQEFLGGRYEIRRGSSTIWQKKKYTLTFKITSMIPRDKPPKKNPINMYIIPKL